MRVGRSKIPKNHLTSYVNTPWCILVIFILVCYLKDNFDTFLIIFTFFKSKVFFVNFYFLELCENKSLCKINLNFQKFCQISWLWISLWDCKKKPASYCKVIFGSSCQFGEQGKYLPPLYNPGSLYHCRWLLKCLPKTRKEWYVYHIKLHSFKCSNRYILAFSPRDFICLDGLLT